MTDVSALPSRFAAYAAGAAYDEMFGSGRTPLRHCAARASRRGSGRAGALAARLRYTVIDAAFMLNLHEFLDSLEGACNQVGDFVAAEFFWGRTPPRRGP
jgi:A predicted alpha-helical domain with a conserved ER motif.